MKFDFDKFVNRHNTNSTKWSKYDDSIIPLWIADSDFKSPPCIIRCLIKRIKHGVFGYGITPSNLIESIISRMESLYNWNIQPEWIVLLPGIVSGLNICVRSFTNIGDLTIFPKPIYPPFFQASNIIKRDYIQVPLVIKKNRWLMDINSIHNKMSGKEKLLMLCNPQNPGGTVYRRKELEEQLSFANKYDLIVCSDEVHCDLILEPGLQHVPFASLGEEALQRTITLISPSKTFNIAGLGVSFGIIANKDLRKAFKKTQQGIVPAVNVLAMEAAISAFNEGNEWLKEQINYLRNNRNLLLSYINSNKYLTMIPPEGTYLGWIDVRKLNLVNPAKFFEKYGLGFSPGIEFGNNDFLRFNFACNHNLLRIAIKRMQNAIINLIENK